MDGGFSGVWTAQHMRQRLVRYGDLIPCTTAFIDARTPGSDKKENFTIIGPGVAESPDQHVHISEPHGFNIGGARQPPRCNNSQHFHETAEVFLVHSGTWAFRTGEHADEGEVILHPGDVISIPVHIFRGFENVGRDTGFLFAVLGGDDPGRVVWAPNVIEAARTHGLVLLESGRLIDTLKGEKVPDGAAVTVPEPRELLDAKVVSCNSVGLRRCVMSGAELQWSRSPLADGGVTVAPVLGRGGKMDWAHGFVAQMLRFEPMAQLLPHARAEATVLFVQTGAVIFSWQEGELVLGAGDTFTIPANLVHTLRSDASDAIVFQVIGTDEPSSPAQA
jgi:quercetin dioxygenase-like cupin family protein